MGSRPRGGGAVGGAVRAGVCVRRGVGGGLEGGARVLGGCAQLSAQASHSQDLERRVRATLAWAAHMHACGAVEAAAVTAAGVARVCRKRPVRTAGAQVCVWGGTHCARRRSWMWRQPQRCCRHPGRSRAGPGRTLCARRCRWCCTRRVSPFAPGSGPCTWCGPCCGGRAVARPLTHSLRVAACTGARSALFSAARCCCGRGAPWPRGPTWSEARPP